MDEERIEAMIGGSPGEEVVDPAEAEAAAGGDDQLRTPVTILFSDIKGSTAYFERKGDVEGLAMLERHNNLLLPCIEGNNGRLVKTIGDALMTEFRDPVDALRAAVQMQNALFEDGRGRAESEQIQIRVGVHTGLALLRGNDVFGDVVNAAAKVQSKALPDQILITDSLVPAARTAGYQIGRLGRTKLEGKEEPIDVFTMAWSADSTQRLIDDLQSRFEDQVRDLKQARMTSEEDFDSARSEWRRERRELHAEVARLEDALREAMATAREEITEDFRRELRFELEKSEKARVQAERDLESTHERFEAERVGYRAQIETLEKRVVETLDRVNNPARMAAEVQRQVEERLERARRQSDMQWAGERERMTRDLAQAQKTGKHDALAEARRQVQERLRARQGNEGKGDSTTAASGEIRIERDALKKRVGQLEAEAQDLAETTRREISRDLRRRFEERSEQAARVQGQLEHEVETLRRELAAQKESWTTRLSQLEASIPEAQEAARTQAIVEVEGEYQEKLDEAERARAAMERRLRDDSEEWDFERSKLMGRLDDMEMRLEEARDLAFRRSGESGEPAIEELNRLRHQLEEEYRDRHEAWDVEKRDLLDRIRELEDAAGQ